MFITLYTYLIITTATALLYDGWEEHSTPLFPRQLAHNAIGHDASNHIIWLLGDRIGFEYTPQQLVAYDYINNKITDHGATALPRFVYGETQFYAQIGSIIYIGDYWESYINTFNMETTTFESNYALPPLNFVSTFSCVVSIRDDYLSLLGNDGNVQILDIHSQQWLQSVPSLIIGRSRSSCAYIHDKVFNIGGFNNNNGGRQSSIEYLDVSITSMVDIGSTYWQYNTDSLPYPIQNCRSIAVNNDVLVIGGYNGSYNSYLNTVYTIDGVTGSVSLRGHLSKTVIDFALIVADNILYSFGGKEMDNGDNGWRQWQTKSLASITSTTTTTTAEPTATTTESTAMVQTTEVPPTTAPTATKPSTTPSKTQNDDETVSYSVIVIVLTCICIFMLCIYIRCLGLKKRKQMVEVEDMMHNQDIADNNQIKRNEKGRDDTIRIYVDSIEEAHAMHNVAQIKHDNGVQTTKENIIDDNYDIEKKGGEGINNNPEEMVIRTEGETMNEMILNDGIGDDEFIIQGDDETTQ